MSFTCQSRIAFSGDSLDLIAKADSTLFQFVATQDALYASPRGSYEDSNPLANVTVLGVADTVSVVSLNNVTVPDSCHSYDAKTKVLTITGLESLTKAGAWSAEWVLTWS